MTSWHKKLFGSKKREPSWGQIEKLMKMQLEANRTNLHGIFANYDWLKGPDGSWTQKASLDPSLEMGKQRVMDRASKGTGDPYTSPAQFSQMLDASMAHQQARQGLPGASPQAAGFGPPSADRAGLAAQAWTPPPPPAEPPPGAAPPPGTGGMTEEEYRALLARAGGAGAIA